MSRKHDEHELDQGTTTGYKLDAGKARMELLPPRTLQMAAEVFTHGAAKYASSDRADENNWTEGMLWGRMYGALQRHLQAFWGGEDEDPDSGMPHLAHALCCMMMLAEYGTNEAYSENDDRFKGAPKQDEVEFHITPDITFSAPQRPNVSWYRKLEDWSLDAGSVEWRYALHATQVPPVGRYEIAAVQPDEGQRDAGIEWFELVDAALATFDGTRTSFQVPYPEHIAFRAVFNDALDAAGPHGTIWVRHVRG